MDLLPKIELRFASLINDSHERLKSPYKLYSDITGVILFETEKIKQKRKFRKRILEVKLSSCSIRVNHGTETAFWF